MVRLMCGIVGVANSIFSVRVDDGDLVDELKKAIKTQKPNDLKDVDADKLQLFLAKTTDGDWLRADDPTVLGLVKGTTPQVAQKMLDGERMSPIYTIQHWLFDKNKMPQPSLAQLHVLVLVPKVVKAATSMPNGLLPAIIELNEPAKFAKECISLFDWGCSAEEYISRDVIRDPVVHKIPLIWNFMENLGGCTKTGEIYWRMEEKKVVAMVVDGWFRESSPNNANDLKGMKSIVMGSPGIGKSTLLCVMAFYLVFEHNKNVLVYRKLADCYCLFYLGHEKSDDEDKFVYFTVPECEPLDAKNIYKNLKGTSDVWLLLDGFRFEDVPFGLRTFEMLATSQQTHLMGKKEDVFYTCLLPCWSKKDLIFLGSKIYNFDGKDMEKRYYCSGGCVRWFTKPNLNEVRNAINSSISLVDNVSRLLSSTVGVLLGGEQFDDLRRTFWINPKKSFMYLKDWEQVIDSEYAVKALAHRLPWDALSIIYLWAKKSGNRSLAGIVFEEFLRRLISDNIMALHISRYNLPTYGKPKEREVKEVQLKRGRAMCSEAVKVKVDEKCSKRQKKAKRNIDEYEADLIKWRDDEEYSYWYPKCHNFPNIDSVVKLESGGVAYLQFTVAAVHGINTKNLIDMNAIFNSAGDAKTGPIYIAVCPDLDSCKDFVLKPLLEAQAAEEVCPSLYVGYC